VKGGELIRVRERFPTLFEDDYHPDVYTIGATQIPLGRLQMLWHL